MADDVDAAAVRVLMSADPIGGVFTYALELCAALASVGNEIALATLGGPLSAEQRRSAAALPNVRVYESSFRLEWMPDPWADLARAADWLLDLEARLCPQVIHLNHLAHGDLPWRAPVLIVGHSCVLSWWAAVRGGRAPPAWRTYRERVTASLRGASAVAAPTRAMLRALVRHYGPLPASRVISNGRSPELFGAQRKEPIILTAGRLWDEAKGLELLDRAAPGVRWPILAAGALEHDAAARADASGSDAGAADARAPANRVGAPGCCAAGRVQLLGPLTPAALAGWYARAAIYALPARYEPFGLTALEAALSGCALVLGDIESLREVWADAALYVDPRDPGALRGALEALATNAERREELARRARRRACAYSPQAMAAAYLSLYDVLRAVSPAGNLRAHAAGAAERPRERCTPAERCAPTKRCAPAERRAPRERRA